MVLTSLGLLNISVNVLQLKSLRANRQIRPAPRNYIQPNIFRINKINKIIF